MSEWNKAIIKEFRANDGKVGGAFADIPLLLLHTTGAKSGQERVNPAAYLVDGNRLVIFASNAGAPTNPNWYYNIVANPEVSVEVGAEQFRAQATIADGPERTQLFEKMAALNPGFATYQQKTTRTIPAIILTRKL
ncbi:MAG: nitroreductase family deazaflavin-dependent oxidoreductase [Anaerolineae bacterium]